MTIIIIGFMGSGKSTVGACLANRLGLRFFDSDNLFESRYGSIRDVFAFEGEDVFRQRESQILHELDWTQNFILATGGGIITRWQNMLFLRNRGRIVLLEPGFDVIQTRLRDDVTRPLWQESSDEQARVRLYQKRVMLYRRYADLIVTSGDGSQIEELIVKYADF